MPQCNGLSEENVKTIKNIINAYLIIEQNTWDQHLNELCYAYNTAEHCATKFTPFEVKFGQLPKIPIDLFHTYDESHSEDNAENELDLTYGD